MTTSEVMTVKEAATALKITTKTVYHLARTERLKSVRIGPKSIRITRDSLMRFVNGEA